MELEVSPNKQQIGVCSAAVWDKKNSRLASIDVNGRILMDTPFSSMSSSGQRQTESRTTSKKMNVERRQQSSDPRRTSSSTADVVVMMNAAGAPPSQEVSSTTRNRGGDSSSSSSSSTVSPASDVTTIFPSIPPPTARTMSTTSTTAANNRRSRCFQRAFSCDVDNHKNPSAATVTAAAGTECSSQLNRCQELEMSYVENDDIDELDDINDHSASAGSSSPSLNTPTTKDSGIVCSDEDLRYILTEVTSHTKKMSVEAKREKMKSNRSLSLDSSFFKLHMKRLQADSPGWLSRILNQRDRSNCPNTVTTTVAVVGGSSTEGLNKGNATTMAAINTTVTDGGGSGAGPPQMLGPLSHPSMATSEIMRKRSISKKPEASPETIAEDPTSSFDDDSSCHRRRESNESCESDDEHSLLLANNPHSPIICSSTRSSNMVTTTMIPQPPPSTTSTAVSVSSASSMDTSTSTTFPRNNNNNNNNADNNQLAGLVASKVLWNEDSVVDAQVLGTAIEFYLTSVNNRKPSRGENNIKCSRPEEASAATEHGQTTNSVPVPVVSTLKGLFVK